MEHNGATVKGLVDASDRILTWLFLCENWCMAQLRDCYISLQEVTVALTWL